MDRAEPIYPIWQKPIWIGPSGAGISLKNIPIRQLNITSADIHVGRWEFLLHNGRLAKIF